MRIGCRIGWSSPYALVLALFLGLLAAPQVASSQSVEKLVGNTGKDIADDSSTTTPTEYAQAFTTGSNASGYLLTRVDIRFLVSGTGDDPDFTITVRDDLSGAPDTTLATLSAAGGLATGINRYNAPAGGVSLAPNATYHVVLDLSAWGGRKLVKIAATASDDEDDGAAAGWSIANTSRDCDPAGGCQWATEPTESANSKQIEIYGTANETDPPVLIGAEAVTSTSLVLTYDEKLDTGSVPVGADFTVTASGGTGANPSNVAIDGSKVTLTLAAADAISISDTVTVSYVKPTGTDPNPIQDLVGNDAAEFTNQAVTVDSSAIALSSVGVDGTRMRLTFNRVLDASSEPAASDFTVKVNNVETTVTDVEIVHTDVRLQWATAVTSADTVTVSYLVPTETGANPIKDRFGNNAAAFTDQPATHTDATPPTIRPFNCSNGPCTQATHGQEFEVWLKFNEPLDETSVPDVDDFAFEMPTGTAVGVVAVRVAGSDVVLTTATRMAIPGSNSSLDGNLVYTAGRNPIQDLAGNVTAYAGGVISLADTIGPVPVGARLNGTGLTITYNEEMTATNVEQNNGLDNWTVKVDGTAVTITAAVQQTPGPRWWIRLTLQASVDSADRRVTVSYREGDPTNAPLDQRANFAPAFTDLPVTVSDTTAPTFQSGTAIGKGITLTYNELLNSNSVPDAGDFSVTVNSGTPASPSSVAIEDKNVLLTLASAVPDVSTSPTVTVTYTVGTQPIQDRRRNSAVALTDQAVTVVADTTAPAFQSATAEGAELTLTYDEPLDAASVPAATAFTVMVDDSSVGLVANSPVAVSGSAVTLTLASTVPHKSTSPRVTVTYIVGANPIRDTSENNAAALTNQVVIVEDTAAPTIQSAQMQGTELRLIYSEPLNEATPPTSAFLVAIDSADGVIPSSVDVTGAVVALQLTVAPVRAEQQVTVSYIQPGTNPIQDPSGNRAAGFSDRSVDITDTIAPMFQSASVRGTVLTLTYDETLEDDEPFPTASAFTVTVKEDPQDPTPDERLVNLAAANPVAVSGSTVVLTLDEDELTRVGKVTLSADWEVTVSYAVPEENPIRDAQDNAAAALTDEMVEVTDETPPTLDLDQSPPTVLGALITLDFVEKLDPNSKPEPSAFTVEVTKGGATSSGLAAGGSESVLAVTSGGTPVSVTNVGISGSMVMLTLAEEVMPGEPVTVSYQKPAVNPLKDRTGNEIVSFSGQTVLSSVATLSELMVKDEDGMNLDLDPVFPSRETFSHTVQVRTAVTMAQVTATLADPRATLTASLTKGDGSENPVAVISGEAFDLSELAFGENVLTITVTAQDTKTTETYTLTVERKTAGTAPMKAWLARFGRTVAEHALDGVAGRMRASRMAGFRGEIGGLPPASMSSSGTGFDRHDRRGRDVREASVGEMLLGSSFSMTGEADGSGGTLAYWGRAAQTRFDGRDGNLSVDGEVTTGMAGLDYSRDRWTLGLTLMHSDGDGGYSDGESSDAGRIGATLTAVVPWSSWQATERLDFWGAVGKGSGEATLTPEGGAAVRSDIGWSMAALGMRNELMSPADAGYAAGTGPSLALNMDAMWVRTTSGAAASGELSATTSEVSRLRVGVEGEWGIGLENGGRLVPHMELAVRRDGGDAEVGAGFELGGGLIWQDPELGLSMELAGRTLMAHDVEGRKESGYAVSMVYDPAPATARGASFSLRQDWGAQASGGVDTLFSSGPMPSVGGSGSSSGRWEAEAAYGIPAFGGDFTASPHVGFGQSDGGQDYSLGWRVTPEGTGAPDLSVGLETTRQERAGAAAKHGIGIGVSANW